MHFNEVLLGRSHHSVLMNIQRFNLLRLVQFVNLSLFFDEILRHFFICHCTHVKRLVDILTHLLLFKTVLPLFDLEVLSIYFLQILIHLLILAK